VATHPYTEGCLTVFGRTHFGLPFLCRMRVIQIDISEGNELGGGRQPSPFGYEKITNAA